MSARRTPRHYQNWEKHSEAVRPLVRYLTKGTNIGNRHAEVGDLRENGKRRPQGHCDGQEQGDDFLSCQMPAGVDAIVTNPPHRDATDFLCQCYVLKKPFAMLLPLRYLEHSQIRFEYFTAIGLQLLFLNERIHYIGKLGQECRTTFDSVWFCWRLLPKLIVFERV